MVCPHGRRRGDCGPCGGSHRCVHGRIKWLCTACKSGGSDQSRIDLVGFSPVIFGFWGCGAPCATTTRVTVGLCTLIWSHNLIFRRSSSADASVRNSAKRPRSPRVHRPWHLSSAMRSRQTAKGLHSVRWIPDLPPRPHPGSVRRLRRWRDVRAREAACELRPLHPASTVPAWLRHVRNVHTRIKTHDE